MDLTSTAQTAAPIAAAAAPWWHYVLTSIATLFCAPFAKPVLTAVASKAASIVGSTQVQNVVKEAEALAPAAATIATLAGQPALAGGIETAAAIAKQVSTLTNPDQLATLAVMHAQALAAAGAPPMPVLAPQAPADAPQEAALAPQAAQALAPPQAPAQARP